MTSQLTNSANYCPECGQELEDRFIEGRIRPFCPKCDSPRYRNAKPCAGVLVTDETEILLVQRSNPPAVDSWSVPAGYLEFDERPKAAAVRELTEETGVVVDESDIKLFETNLVALENGTRVLVLLYTAQRKNATGSLSPGSDAADAQFWDLQTLLSSEEDLEPGYTSIFRRAISSEPPSGTH